MFRRLNFLALALLFSAIGSDVQGALVNFNLLDPTGTANTAGEAFEAGMPFTNMGITLSAIPTTTLGSGSGTFSANTTSAGINSAGTTADGASEVDAGETLTFTVSFAPSTIVSLTSIDFSGIGSDATDAAFVSINGGSAISLFTGQPDFNGGTDVFTPTIGITSGDTLAISAADAVGLQEISFHATALAVPEASSLFALSLCGFAVLTRRRRA